MPRGRVVTAALAGPGRVGTGALARPAERSSAIAAGQGETKLSVRRAAECRAKAVY